MEQYTAVSYAASKLVTNAYSTSFGMSIRLFARSMQPHIYAIYGLVRIADEIVDTYNGSDKGKLLDELELETLHAITTGYSTNPIVHAYAQTAKKYAIESDLIAPFFESMRMDLAPQTFDQKLYDTYIYGSAEVVGLMCLKVFTDDSTLYDKLVPSAGKLGAAYQKVNFLRDIAADSKGLGRWYFPISSTTTFDESAKRLVIEDIETDFAAAKKGIVQLPEGSRRAVQLSYEYYTKLLHKIKQTPAEQLLEKRVRINNLQKTRLYVKTALQKRRHAN